MLMGSWDLYFNCFHGSQSHRGICLGTWTPTVCHNITHRIMRGFLIIISSVITGKIHLLFRIPENILIEMVSGLSLTLF